jgi:hypothetical protein
VFEVALVAADESSEWDDVEAWVELLADVVFPVDAFESLVLPATAVGVTALWSSRQASTPPSDSMEVTLSAVATLRARAARGVRRERPAPAWERGVGVIGSSMAVNVRTSGEWAARSP